MDGDEGRLRRWRSDVGAARAAGAVPAASLDGAGRRLLDRWREAHRRYHGVAHLDAVLVALDTLVAATPGSATAAVPARLAAWFHDAVHEGRAGDDEAASARLAGAELTALGLPDEGVAEVSRLVLLTAGHQAAPGDLAGALLCDADLSILGSEPAAYDRYCRAVRQEYADLPDDAFRAGRLAVLRGLRSLDPLFRTVAAQRLWQHQARANLDREIDRLSPTAAPPPR